MAAFLACWLTLACCCGGAMSCRWTNPNDRSLHETPTPRIGGLGIMAGIAAGRAAGAENRSRRAGSIGMDIRQVWRWDGSLFVVNKKYDLFLRIVVSRHLKALIWRYYGVARQIKWRDTMPDDK